jgi:transforming growth factor-beta-induced protein
VGLLALLLSAGVLMAAGATEQSTGPGTVVDVAVKDGRFTTLVAALKAAKLDTTLMGAGPFTVFAPTDAAFAKLPAGTVDALLKDVPALTKILLYHVVAGRVAAADVVKVTSATTVNGLPVMVKVAGSTVKINDATVQITDIAASNGLIHVVDSVILPPSADIVDVAVANGGFKTLVAAVQAAGLVDTLKSAGPFTVFAPTDAAFAKLPAGTVEALLKDIPRLKAILTYHVVSGRVYAADVVKLSSAPTVQGDSIKVAVDMGAVKLNGSTTVVMTDILTTNGVVHVIDSVLLPPSK